MQSVSELVLNQNLLNTFPLKTNVALRCEQVRRKRKMALKIYLIFFMLNSFIFNLHIS